MPTLGPVNGTLTVRTGRAGAAAKAGHDLVLEVGRWQATLTSESCELTADARSLRVVSGSGGLAPLGESERTTIAKAIDEKVLKGGQIVYRSTSVVERPGGYDVDGVLELLGRSRPLSLTLSVDGDRLTGSAQVKQTDWRIRPYSALLGTLKVADVVEVSIDASLA
jgi:hypothetical protein